MGFIMKDVGKVGIEDRGGSFIIHMSYGMVLRKVAVGDLRPGDDFIASDPLNHSTPAQKQVWRLRSLNEVEAEAESAQFSIVRNFSLERQVEIPDTEDFDP